MKKFKINSVTELRHEELVEKLKYESCRAMFKQQEENHLVEEDTTKETE